MNNAVSVTDLSFSYGRAPVLRDVACTVPAGAFFGIIGPNGSGKTTLMKLLCGILKPARGEIFICGRSRGECTRRALARTVALVPQLPAHDFPFTVREVVLMGRSPHLGLIGLEGPGDHACAARAMEFTGVAHLADRSVDQLSGGELQRVSIARAICQEPRVMLLDEPTASLDLAHQVSVMDLMQQLRRTSGTTIVMVSHDINLAGMYADHLLLLSRGCVARIGAPADVLTEETIEAVYGCPVLVDTCGPKATPRITPVPGTGITLNRAG